MSQFPNSQLLTTNYQIFCTGSSGLVASHFKQTALTKQIPFIGLDLHGEEESVNILDRVALQQFLERKRSSFLKLGEKPVLFHFAAFTATGKNITPEQAELCRKLNVGGTQTILDVCKELDIPVVLISTDFVFAGCHKTTPYSPNDEMCADDTVYVQTKVEAEHLVKQASQNQRVVTIRLAFPYGNPNHPKPDLVRKMLGWMKENHSVGFYADQQTCPTPLSYFSQCCLKTAEFLASDRLESGTILHCVGKPTTPYQFALLVQEAFEVKAEILPKAIGETGPRNLVLATDKTEETLGLEPLPHKEALQELKVMYEL